MGVTLGVGSPIFFPGGFITEAGDRDDGTR
jgi:hypothetical protein